MSMGEFIPMFPLKIVAFPGEKINLHIFEPRYIQLIADVLKEEHTFGIPVFLKQVSDHGTMVRIEKVIKKYDDGKMDITAVGLSVFKIKQFINPLVGKLYAGATVEPVTNIQDGESGLREKIRYELEYLLSNANIHREVTLGENISTFHVAHIIGLTIEEEYQLLKLNHEKDRQEFVLHHLEKIMPEVDRLKEIKRRISGNGHFKKFDSLDF
jgi:hypothetical protein